MQMFERFGSLPMYESLKYRHFWAFFMSMVMPFTYIVTLLYIGVCWYLRRGPWRMVIPGVTLYLRIDELPVLCGKICDHQLLRECSAFCADRLFLVYAFSGIFTFCMAEEA